MYLCIVIDCNTVYMNLSTLIKNYFASKGDDVTIDVFDEKTSTMSISVLLVF